MKKQYIQARLKKEGDKFTFVASDETLDRANEVIPMESWDLNNYLKNPVLLVNHDYMVENIVGLATNISTASGKLTFEPVFHEITELARNVKQMIMDGFLNSVSVGFLPHGPEKDGDRVHNELLEISFVAVGANPNALRLNAIAGKSLSDDKKKEVEAWLTKQNETLELQRIEFDKKIFKEQADVENWLTENSYTKAEIIGNDKVYVVKYFDDAKCEVGTEKEMDLGDGIKIYGCKTAIREVNDPAKNINRMLIDVKEGRVLSGRNRKQIQNAVEVLEQASATLKEMLEATNPDSGKDIGEKVEQAKVEQETNVPSKAPLSVVRVLQGINRNTNDLLRELKKQ